MQKHYPAVYDAKQFNCVHCGVYAMQFWTDMYIDAGRSMSKLLDWRRCKCAHCGQASYWFKEAMVVPSQSTLPPAHEDFPQDARADYNEARDIVTRSPKAAAALLRLCLQKLMPAIGETGKNINDDIASLVSKGLPPFVQQALDYCRVVGNNAVHPGEIVLDDTPEIALALFDMLNLIVEQRIAVPKRIADHYGLLPEAARAAIEKRDRKDSSN